MISSWATTTLGETCSFVRGPFGGSLKKSVFVKDGFAVYEQQHAIYNQFEDIRYFIDDIKFKEMQRFELHPNDIIMSCSGTMGKVAIVPKDIRPGIINQALLKLTPSKGISAEFLKYWMISTDFQDSLREQSGGAAIQNVPSVSILKEIKILLPSLPEQQRIVGILDEAFEGIAKARANAKKNLQNARALFNSHLNEVFTQGGEGWMEKSLDEVCEIIMGQSPKGESYNTIGQGMPLINGPVEFSADPFGKTICSKFTTQPTKLCKAGDLLVCVRGSTTGRINIAGFDACIGRGVAAIRAKEHQPWINQFINAKREEIFSLGTGATFPNVSCPMLSKLKISMPAPSEQKKIVEKLEILREKTQNLEIIYLRKITALDELKQSLLHQAFTGQL